MTMQFSRDFVAIFGTVFIISSVNRLLKHPPLSIYLSVTSTHSYIKEQISRAGRYRVNILSCQEFLSTSTLYHNLEQTHSHEKQS